MVAARSAARDQRFKYLLHVLTEQLGYRHAVHRFLAVRIFMCGIRDFMLFEHAHHIGFIRSHFSRSNLRFIQIL